MKKFLTIFFVVLGVIFFVLMLIAVYFYITDPLNLKPLLFDREAAPDITTEEGETLDKHPLLNESQEQILETIGVDPAALPTEITPAQEACFIEVLGSARVQEIKAGDTPTGAEFFTARACLE